MSATHPCHATRPAGLQCICLGIGWWGSLNWPTITRFSFACLYLYGFLTTACLAMTTWKSGRQWKDEKTRTNWIFRHSWLFPRHRHRDHKTMTISTSTTSVFLIFIATVTNYVNAGYGKESSTISLTAKQTRTAGRISILDRVVPYFSFLTFSVSLFTMNMAVASPTHVDGNS